MRVSFSDIAEKDFKTAMKTNTNFLRNGVGLVGLVAMITGMMAPPAAAAPSAQELREQRAQYEAVRPKTIIELQPFRDTAESLVPGSGQPLRLISLNPQVNGWFLLQIGADGARDQASYHLENPRPRTQSVSLVTVDMPVLMIGDKACAPWAGAPSELQQARASRLPYAPICGGRLYLRNRSSGRSTTLESTASFLRKHILGGDEIVGLVKSSLYRDYQLEISKDVARIAQGDPSFGPGAAQVRTRDGKRAVIGTYMALGLEGTKPGQMGVGLWYPVVGLKGVFASAIQPRRIAEAVLKGPGKTNWLDSVESRATDYMVAFDLGRYTFGYEVGTTHPALGWSSRPPWSVRPRGMPGPDGISTAKPLERTGMVSPASAARTIATFTGGFKRDHGAFKYGDYATVDFGKHYGFIEHGVILSKLWPDLSTLFMLDDGTMIMKTWRKSDDVLLPRIRFARQNGVPLIERDPKTGLGIPGDRVTRWGPGNWSGSADAVLRTSRAGACIRRNAGRRYLIYGYFSTATPSAMARTFQAYGCEYAMLLDMNALEHTYLALYIRRAGEVTVEHLVPGMALIDKKDRRGNRVPRFLGYPDNRDFFYIMKREGAG